MPLILFDGTPIACAKAFCDSFNGSRNSTFNICPTVFGSMNFSVIVFVLIRYMYNIYHFFFCH